MYSWEGPLSWDTSHRQKDKLDLSGQTQKKGEKYSFSHRSKPSDYNYRTELSYFRGLCAHQSVITINWLSFFKVLNEVRDSKEGSVANSYGWSSIRTGFHSKHAHVNLQPSLTPVQKAPTSFSALLGTSHTWSTDMHEGKTPVNKRKRVRNGIIPEELHTVETEGHWTGFCLMCSGYGTEERKIGFSWKPSTCSNYQDLWKVSLWNANSEQH